jgi:hypothetical protein
MSLISNNSNETKAELMKKDTSASNLKEQLSPKRQFVKGGIAAAGLALLIKPVSAISNSLKSEKASQKQTPQKGRLQLSLNDRAVARRRK